MYNENAEEKNATYFHENRINFFNLTGNGQLDKRIEYLWNLALSSVYGNAKLSMKYVSLIKNITKNTLYFDNICCHHCNLIYIPFYNCEVKQMGNKNVILYQCKLCNSKKKINILNLPKNDKNNLNEFATQSKKHLVPQEKIGFFLINEIEENAIKHKTNSIISNGENQESEDNPIAILTVNKDDKDLNNEIIDKQIYNKIIEHNNTEITTDINTDIIISNDCKPNVIKNENLNNQDTAYDDISNLFTIDYGGNNVSLEKGNTFFAKKYKSDEKVSNNIQINNTFKNVNELEGNNNATNRMHKNIQHASNNNNHNIGKTNELYNIKKNNNSKNFNNPNKSNKNPSIPNNVVNDNPLIFNKPKKKRKTILGIL
ncbi:conserved Plasmodium protein, unknown function [Plasmodium berghei]|uniref:Uncharacterized protein n=2 Tax=Plasmodium berghei TaxID=5821 RepID=A0A509AM16_PLABA|nr:conserved Plasmodium protein, unknown function [Plasmodium berghei ANKA]CXI45124.1 conserved Plasmodium protein, unknown function [Plasmodium berghei]SCM22613.1 conserved Plasmodium protein, unknown function [Plasmodium berghei]SCN25550.1 conserved Plasmodium protein, unknown function [Plasmodium berghei]SCO60505.1 conserved Plasmodium protein, unknown function [Plasmodium berghei]SCO62276.1 conserved Plasmodium protein, unknown function [Plasmodium berghei]|eukprot:XP_034421691.1 conserved Plasmodium protein, unknown function [Plasmodium berghei ANKA]